MLYEIREPASTWLCASGRALHVPSVTLLFTILRGAYSFHLIAGFIAFPCCNTYKCEFHCLENLCELSRHGYRDNCEKNTENLLSHIFYELIYLFFIEAT